MQCKEVKHASCPVYISYTTTSAHKTDTARRQIARFSNNG